jgi:uncharacterized surface protein with fasciclin (FAS1) repeats
MQAIGRVSPDSLVGCGLVDHQRLMGGIFLLAERDDRVAMARGHRHVERAEERVVEALATRRQGDMVGARREILVAVGCQGRQFNLRDPTVHDDLAATTNGQTPAFNTFRAALKTTGLAAKVANGSPYLLLAPTDAAFAALPKDQRDALLADPQALGDLLRSHIVEGYYPPRSLSPNPPDTSIDRTVTNLLGAPLALITNGEGLMVNGQAVNDGDTVFVANGTRLIEINSLILPATQAATPVPSTPATVAAPTPMPTTSTPDLPKTGAGVNFAAVPALLVVLALLVMLLGGIMVAEAARRRSAQHDSTRPR